MRILVVDDHQLFLEGLRMVLQSLGPDVEILQARDGAAALQAVEANDLELILLDLNMPGVDGLAILQSLAERQLWIPTVILSASDDLVQIHRALELGALGFISKSAHSREMLGALRDVLRGDVYIPPDLRLGLQRLQRTRNGAPAGNPALQRYGITPRQHEVLRLLARGYSNQQIAETLFLSEHTVKSHVKALFSALHVSNRTECARAAEHAGLLAGP